MASNKKPAADGWEDVPVSSQDGWEDVPMDRSPAAALPPEPGAQETSIPGLGKGGMIGAILDAVGGSSNAVARGFANKASLGNIKPPQMADDESQFPASSMAGKVAGFGASAHSMGKAASAIKPAASALGRIGQAAGTGFLQGAAADPGEVEPGIMGQVKGRGTGGLLGLFLGGGLSAGGELIKKGAQTARDVGLIKHGEASTHAKRAVDEALQALDEKQIAPRDAQLRELLKGKSFEVNPDRVTPTFPRLGGKMAERLEGQPAPARAVLDGNRALRLKRAADAAADYSASKAFDPVASARGEEAKSLADILRRQMNADPAVSQVNREIGEHLALKNALAERARTSPIAAVSPKETTDRGQLIKMIDKAAGSNLEGLGDRLDNASDLLLSPSKLVKPLETMNELRKTAIRGGAEASLPLNYLIERAPEGTKEALIQKALEAKGRVK